MLLAGCVHDPAALPAQLLVDQPAICEQILQEVPMPEVGPDTDAVAAFLADEAALIVANATIASGRACIADQREAYAGKEPVR
jgi:hypothetical protein